MLFVLVLLPLWSSYLARVYAWRLILSKDGRAQLVRSASSGFPSSDIAYTNWAMWIVFTYIWLPFMILPVYAALERIPDSYLEASRDLGATQLDDVPAGDRCRSRCPGIVAGSIFTFSLTLGDYITPTLVGGTARSSSATSSTATSRADEQPAVRGRLRDDPARRDGRSTSSLRAAAGAFEAL